MLKSSPMLKLTPEGAKANMAASFIQLLSNFFLLPLMLGGILFKRWSFFFCSPLECGTCQMREWGWRPGRCPPSRGPPTSRTRGTNDKLFLSFTDRVPIIPTAEETRKEIRQDAANLWEMNAPGSGNDPQVNECMQS